MKQKVSHVLIRLSEPLRFSVDTPSVASSSCDGVCVFEKDDSSIYPL